MKNMVLAFQFSTEMTDEEVLDFIKQTILTANEQVSVIDWKVKGLK